MDLRGMVFFQLTGIFLLILPAIWPGETMAVRASDAPEGAFCLVEQQLTTPGAGFVVASLRRMYHGRTVSDEGLNDLLCLDQSQFETASRRLAEDVRRDTLARRLTDRSLRLMAARDVDEDGILDFRVKEFGTFAENDPDADNDGVPNLLDPRPLSADTSRDAVARNDEDGDGLPNHLDWSTLNRMLPEEKKKPTRLVRLQHRVFRKYRFVLVETEGAVFSEAFADMVYDVLGIFSRMLKQVPAPEAPRSITVAPRYDVEPLGVLAEVSPANDQMVIYTEVVGDIMADPRDRLAPFLVLVHEFTHVIQNAMDYPRNKAGLLRYNTHVDPDNFAQRLKQLGWRLTDKIRDGIDRVVSFVDHENEPISMEAQFEGVSLVALRDMCRDLWEHYNDSLWREHNIVTCYSLDSAREWHAEYLTAAVLIRLYERMEAMRPVQGEDIVCRAQERLFVANGGDTYDVGNADPVKVRSLIDELGFWRWRADVLAKKYLLKPFSPYALTEPICVDPAAS